MDPDRALLVACLDLTSLRDDEDDAAIDALCGRALRPVPGCTGAPRRGRLRMADGGCRPRAAGSGAEPVARRVRDRRVPGARRARSPTGSARSRRPSQAGADEVDVPINRFLLDEPDALRGELDATRAAAGDAPWKAIVETGALRARRDPVPRRRRDRGGSRLREVLHRQGRPGRDARGRRDLGRRGPRRGTAGRAEAERRDPGRRTGDQLPRPRARPRSARGGRRRTPSGSERPRSWTPSWPDALAARGPLPSPKQHTQNGSGGRVREIPSAYAPL